MSDSAPPLPPERCSVAPCAAFSFLGSPLEFLGFCETSWVGIFVPGEFVFSFVLGYSCSVGFQKLNFQVEILKKYLAGKVTER